MAKGFGRQVLPNTIGYSIQVSADGKPEMKPIGVTVDWSTVTAVSGDQTYLDGVIARDGTKALRYGTVLAQITASKQWGPFDSGASDGRQLFADPEKICIVNQTVLEDDPQSLYPPVLEGGVVWKERLLVGTGTQISLANLIGVLKRLRFVSA